MLNAFVLFADAAPYSANAVINPWNSFLIVLIAFAGAVLAARAKNDFLMIAFGAVGIFFGALAASATQKALNYEFTRAETLQASLHDIRGEENTRQAMQENLQLERDSLYTAIRQLQGRVEELENRPAKTPAAAARPARRTAVRPPTGAALAAATPRPQTYSTTQARPKPQNNARYKYVGEFRYGIAPVKGLNNKWGYIAENGDVVVPPFLKASCTLHIGLGGVKNDAGLWGYVDRTGRLVIPYQFTEALAFEEDTQQALVQLNGHWVFINAKGQVTRPAKGSELRARKRIPVVAAR